MDFASFPPAYFCLVHFALLQTAAMAAEQRLKHLELVPRTARFSMVQRGSQDLCAHKLCMNHENYGERLQQALNLLEMLHS